jgi:hypothetical protein
MFSFGFSTLIDLLSWIVLVTLGSKVIATIYLLVVNKTVRDTAGWGAILWWITKITPIIAVPCAIWLAVLAGETRMAWVFAGLGLFAIVAVPLKVRQRRRRIDKKTSV